MGDWNETLTISLFGYIAWRLIYEALTIPSFDYIDWRLPYPFFLSESIHSHFQGCPFFQGFLFGSLGLPAFKLSG